ncbi:MAG TPA: hypothetical protein VHK27_04090 [Gammaproteobacteria bacterium]|nr:hypothetical protein [Gammaproteobacteria bacterium]
MNTSQFQLDLNKVKPLFSSKSTIDAPASGFVILEVMVGVFFVALAAIVLVPLVLLVAVAGLCLPERVEYRRNSRGEIVPPPPANFKGRHRYIPEIEYMPVDLTLPGEK